MQKHSSISLKGLRIFFAFVIALSGFAFCPSTASATTNDLAIQDAEAAVATSKMTLDQASERLSAIASEYDALSVKVNDMQTKIDSMAQDVIKAQDAMIRGREALGTTMAQNYKNNQTSLFLELLLGSSNFSQLTQNLGYVTQIMDYQAGEVETQKAIKEDLEKKTKELTKQKDEQVAALEQIDQKRAEAQQIVSSHEGQYAADSAQLTALREQAAAIQEAQSNSGGAVDPASPDSPSPSPSPTPTPSPSPGPDIAWQTGTASAYGGSTDPSTGPVSRTATGAICDDWSCGVAIPTSWPNYRSYFGRAVEISWNGITVTAVVNDCGGMGGGSRALDLQPGVWKAFGFNSCQGWGVRTISYRFL